MGDELIEHLEPEEKSGLSRRNALKAGVAVGVGAAAWSGISITSLGGTPAYAINCTGAGVPIPLLACRNTDQGNCQNGLRYHTLRTLEAPYEVTNNIVPNSGICCTDFVGGGGSTPLPRFLFPGTLHPVQGFANQKCTVFMEFYIGGDVSCENRNLANRTGFIQYGPSTTGDLTLFAGTPPPPAVGGTCFNNGVLSTSCGPCPQQDVSGTKMTIFAVCTDASFPDECFTTPS